MHVTVPSPRAVPATHHRRPHTRASRRAPTRRGFGERASSAHPHAETEPNELDLRCAGHAVVVEVKPTIEALNATNLRRHDVALGHREVPPEADLKRERSCRQRLLTVGRPIRHHADAELRESALVLHWIELAHAAEHHDALRRLFAAEAPC